MTNVRQGGPEKRRSPDAAGTELRPDLSNMPSAETSPVLQPRRHDLHKRADGPGGGVGSKAPWDVKTRPGSRKTK
jgi:hypothetical protein